MDVIELERDGSRFGPYTTEEFLAYLASGHIVVSDRARIGAQGDFEPVPVVAARLKAQQAADDLDPSHADAKAQSAAATGSGPALPAGFWRRAGAYAIDTLILVFVLSGIVMFLSALRLPPPGDAKGGIFPVLARLDGLILLGVFAIGWPAYFVLFESSRWQATLGKRLLGLIVTDRDGRPLSFQRALGRHVAALLNWLTLTVGWLLAALPPEKRALHDQVAGTRVLNRRMPPWSPWIGVAVLLLAGLALSEGALAWLSWLARTL